MALSPFAGPLLLVVCKNDAGVSFFSLKKTSAVTLKPCLFLSWLTGKHLGGKTDLIQWKVNGRRIAMQSGNSLHLGVCLPQPPGRGWGGQYMTQSRGQTLERVSPRSQEENDFPSNATSGLGDTGHEPLPPGSRRLRGCLIAAERLAVPTSGGRKQSRVWTMT